MPKVTTPKNYTKETFKTKEEWLNARGLGGSSASAILGKNPRMSVLELYKAIVMPSKHPISKTNELMTYGTKCEPLIRKLFALDFKEYRVHSPKNYEMYRRIDKPYMTATVDGILYEKGTKRKGVLEIKTHDVRSKQDLKEWEGHVPDNYFIQVLHYMLVLNDVDFVIVPAKLRFFDFFDPTGKKLIKTEIRYYRIDRNDERIKKQLAFLEKKETKFWEENITNKVMPELKIKF